jgi:hypothetical protein
LLDHRVHVTDVAQILETSVSCRRTLVHFRRVDYLYRLYPRLDRLKSLADDLVRDLFVEFADSQDEFVDGLARLLLLAGGFLPEQTVVPKQSDLLVCHLFSEVEVGEKFSATLDGQLVLLVEDVPQQNLRHFTHTLLLHPELRHQHREDPEVLRDDVGEGDVLEHLVYVKVLVGVGVETQGQNETVELSEQSVR